MRTTRPTSWRGGLAAASAAALALAGVAFAAPPALAEGPIGGGGSPGDGVTAPTSIDQFATQLGISTVCRDGRVAAAVYSTMKAGTPWSQGDGTLYIGGMWADVTPAGPGEIYGWGGGDPIFLESTPELWLLDDVGWDGVTFKEGDIATVRYAIGDNNEDGIPISTTLDCSAPGAVYRFWSPKFNNAHFFTTDYVEAATIIESDANWSYEGVAFEGAPAANGTCNQGSAVHRFYSPVFQSHFFTQDAAETAQIVATDRNWTYEGVAYCAATAPAEGTTPLYRFWSPAFGKHFFTADQAEADHIRAVDRNWNYEGVAYYVWGS